jgi:prepilin-type N-terminal cleavage/methylation domain-containing protein
MKVSKKFSKGFTLIEMLVTMGIFSVLSAVVVFQYGQFNSQTILTNMAYEIALAAREAQVYALGVRNISGDNFNNRYGIYINKSEDPEGKNFVFFIDRPDLNNENKPNGKCDGDVGVCLACSAGSECLYKYTLSRDIFIDKICMSLGNVNPVEDGNCDIDNTPLNDLHLTFERPNPDAMFFSTSYNNSEDPIQSVGIVIRNRFDSYRTVVIKSTGQISVEF